VQLPHVDYLKQQLARLVWVLKLVLFGSERHTHELKGRLRNYRGVACVMATTTTITTTTSTTGRLFNSQQSWLLTNMPLLIIQKWKTHAARFLCQLQIGPNASA